MALTKEVRKEAAEFYRRWFRANPSGSTHQCLKAANNARVPTLPDICAEVHTAIVNARMAEMLTTAARPETATGPRLVTVEPEESMADNRVQPQNETEALKAASKTLLAAMRLHGIGSCLLTVTDGEDGPSAEWAIEYKKRATGKVAL